MHSIFLLKKRSFYLALLVNSYNFHKIFNYILYGSGMPTRLSLSPSLSLSLSLNSLSLNQRVSGLAFSWIQKIVKYTANTVHHMQFFIVSWWDNNWLRLWTNHTITFIIFSAVKYQLKIYPLLHRLLLVITLWK